MEHQPIEAIGQSQEPRHRRVKKNGLATGAAALSLTVAAGIFGLKIKSDENSSANTLPLKNPKQTELNLDEVHSIRAAKARDHQAQLQRFYIGVHQSEVKQFYNGIYWSNVDTWVTALEANKHQFTSVVHHTHSNSTPNVSSNVSLSTSPSMSDQQFLACTRGHESDTAGGYQAVSPGGVYRGAYQFLQSTWNSVASSNGRGDLVGVDPAHASSADQDALATDLYHAQGNAPWGGRC